MSRFLRVRDVSLTLCCDWCGRRFITTVSWVPEDLDGRYRRCLWCHKLTEIPDRYRVPYAGNTPLRVTGYRGS